MALPKRRHSKARRDRRRTHWKLDTPTTASCPQCGAAVQLHHICGACGYYGNQQLLKVKEKKAA